MKARHALITAAGPDFRRLPMQNLYDQQGDWKAAMVIQVEELFEAGIEMVGVVVKPDERLAYEQLLAGFGGKVSLMCPCRISAGSNSRAVVASSRSSGSSAAMLAASPAAPP